MKGIDTRHKDYDKFAAKWKRCRDTSAGQDAVHAAGTAYLPRLKDQENEDYAAYVKRAGFYNATWTTLKVLRGMMFRKPPQSELPATVATYEADIDMEGTDLGTFAREVALEVLGVGRVGILVDHPQLENVLPMVRATAEKLGLRPMLKTYLAETIINWRHERINNRWMLSMVVFEETAKQPDPDNPYAEKEVKQWRVLELVGKNERFYRQQVWQKAENSTAEFVQIGEDVWPMMNNRNLTEIPFVIVGPDGIDTELDEPPLIDLVDANLDHYRLRADYRHGLHFTGLPTLFLSGIQPDDNGNSPTFYIGSQAAILAPDPTAKGMFIEFTGQGLNALRDALNDLKDEMAVLGARMLATEKRAVEAAETAAIHRTGENSSLADTALAISQALEWALGMMSEWGGGERKAVYQLNRDYNPAMLSAQQITALLGAVQAGKLSHEAFFDLLQRGDVVDSEVTFEEEQERIAATDLPAPKPANDGQGSVAA